MTDHMTHTDLTAEDCAREMLRYFDAYCLTYGRPATWDMRSEVFELLCGRSAPPDWHPTRSREVL